MNSSKDYYEELEAGILVLKDLILNFKNNNKIEIEIRIGRIVDVNFFPGLLKIEFFEKILLNLKSNKNWTQIQEINTKEYVFDSFKLVTKDDKPIYKISKNVKFKKDFIYENSPYDIRIAAAEENYSTSSLETIDILKCKFIREKKRTKFFYKQNYVIDITKVNEIINTVSKEKYEVEVELININDLKENIKYTAHSALLLIRDMINFCEELNEDSELFELEVTKN